MSLLSFTKKIVGTGGQAKTKRATTAPAKKTDGRRDSAMSAAGELGLTPLVTEKTVSGNTASNTVAFRVRPSATKGQVMAAIAERYNIRPLRVRSLHTTPKNRRRGVSVGKTTAWKKVYVTLPPGKSIDLSV